MRSTGELLPLADTVRIGQEIASALDIYADEMSTSSELSPLLEIDCPNEEIKSILSSLYSNVLNLEFNLFGWCRTMVKFGDFFLYLDIEEEHGTEGVRIFLSEIRRDLGQDVERDLERAFNVTPQEFNNDFRNWLRDRYLPNVLERQEAGDFAHPVMGESPSA